MAILIQKRAASPMTNRMSRGDLRSVQSRGANIAAYSTWRLTSKTYLREQREVGVRITALMKDFFKED
jgi:hypothetical protein